MQTEKQSTGDYSQQLNYAVGRLVSVMVCLSYAEV